MSTLDAVLVASGALLVTAGLYAESRLFMWAKGLGETMNEDIATAAEPTAEQRADAEAEARLALERRIFDALFPRRPDSNLEKHADRELRLAGLFDPDADYAGAIAHQVFELIRVFAAQGHSGQTAPMVADLFGRLALYRTLTRSDHTLHRDVSEFFEEPPGTSLQDERDSRWISRDGGKTWAVLGEPDRA